MELKQIKELMASMGRSGMKRLKLKKEGFELELERESDDGFNGYELPQEALDEKTFKTHGSQRAREALGRAESQTTSLTVPKHEEGSKVQEETGFFVTSPMVGTFYAAPSPDDPPFVKKGDRIEKDTVVCIIEAMKVMNEVKAGVSGVIADILIESGHPVEFGTKLIRVI